MKKTLLLLITVSLITVKSEAQDKAFQKGNLVIGAGIGFAGYGTEARNEYDEVYWTGSAIATRRVSQTKSDGAAATILPLTVEYGVTNWLGVGGRFGYSKYISNGDSTYNHIVPTVRSLDGDLMVNLHFVKTVHFDMPLSILVGYSNFSYKSNDANQSMAKDNGIHFGLALVPRIYFGNHIGIFFNLGYMGYKYPSMTFSDKNDSNLNDTNNNVYSLKGSGVNVGMGLTVKF